MPSPQPTAPDLAAGIALFNQGDYYACHDVLEAIWMEAATLDKPFYQGILQIAVGLYHLGNHNWQGASILLGEGVNRLRPFEPDYKGIAVAPLVDCGWAWLTVLQQVGASQVGLVAAVVPQAQGEATHSGAADPEANISLVIGDQRLTLPLLHVYQAENPAP